MISGVDAAVLIIIALVVGLIVGYDAAKAKEMRDES